MFRRSFSRSFSRARTRFRARPRSRLRIPTEPRRWEVCNLVFTTATIVDTATPTFTSVVALAQLADHFGDANTEQGRALNNAARFMEIGGMVFSYALNLEASGVTNTERSGIWANNRLDHRILICSDRLDTAGQPVSIPDWFIPGTPLVAVTGTTPGVEDEEYPTRIHWQDRIQVSPNNLIAGPTGGSGQPALQATTRAAGRANLRLRLRLTDNQGLFFHFGTRVSDVDSTENVWATNCDVTGTLYYRVRF